MSETVRVGAVAYDPRVVTIWEGFKEYFSDAGVPTDYVLYSNYEAATKQFRLRVRDGSPVAVASTDDSEDMQSGSYDVQDEDLPLKQIYQCDATDWTKLCIRDLKAGEKNGAVGIRP